MDTILLSRSDVEELLTMADTMEAMEKAFVDLDKGEAIMPQRTPISVPDNQGLALFMPAYIKGMHALGAKVVSVYKENMSKHRLPVVLGTIILLDDETGFPLAIMEGGFITAMRTGAVGGVATKYMARDDAKVGMIFGTGVQAFTQVLAMCEARKFEKILAFSLDDETAKQDFEQRVEAATGVDLEIVNTPEEGVRQADVITLATSAGEPIVQREWFKPGAHINGIGAHAPHMREIDEATVCDSRIVCDLVSACKAEAGDFMIPAEEGKFDWDCVAGNLGQVIMGDVKGRENDEEITIFKSVGLAIQDMSCARAVYEKAVKENSGTRFEF